MMLSGEFRLIDKIRRRAETKAELRLGIGDDCSSIVVPPNHELLTSTDLLLEDVHFRLDWTDLHSLGIKTIAVNVSDIAAMGARPLSIHLAVGLPAHFDNRQVGQFLDGVFTALEYYDISLAGGDTCRSSGPFMISVTVQGVSPEHRIIKRAGASVGDDVWVSGSLGDSGLALRLLQSGKQVSAFLAERHFRPVARVRLGSELATKGLATAMLDLSDGLSGDLGHLLKASHVGARVELAKLPLSKEFLDAMPNDSEAYDLALSGGEDYELLFTASPDHRTEIEQLASDLSLPLHNVGEITAGSELNFYLGNGRQYHPQQAAFDHFCQPKEKSLG